MSPVSTMVNSWAICCMVAASGYVVTTYDVRLTGGDVSVRPCAL
jgi:hypothetical protein